MKRLTIRDIQKMKDDHERIVMLTAYDATSAQLAEQAGVPMLLVGDTLGMVVQLGRRIKSVRQFSTFTKR